jgi:hypothetical protein
MKPLQITPRTALVTALSLILLAASVDSARTYAKSHSETRIGKALVVLTGHHTSSRT